MCDVNYVILKVVDVLGREVATLVDEVKEPGAYTVEWNARQTDGGRAQGIPSGVYFYRLEATSTGDPGMTFVEMRKMSLVK